MLAMCPSSVSRALLHPLWVTKPDTHARMSPNSHCCPTQVQNDVTYITGAVSDRVGHYVSSVMSVPGVTNAHLQAFLNTSTVPLSALGFQQSPAVRDALAGFLTATAAGAALLYLDQDVELYIGMGDGMVRARPHRVSSPLGEFSVTSRTTVCP